MTKNIFHELRMKQHDEDFEPRDIGLPTGARAGTLEKLLVITERVERGQSLFHAGDNPLLATISEEFEKSKFINRIFRERLLERQTRRKD